MAPEGEERREGEEAGLTQGAGLTPEEEDPMIVIDLRDGNQGLRLIIETEDDTAGGRKLSQTRVLGCLVSVSTPRRRSWRRSLAGSVSWRILRSSWTIIPAEAVVSLLSTLKPSKTPLQLEKH